MFTLSGIRKFHDWTHSSLKPLLEHLSTIRESDYVRELPNSGLPSLQKQMLHIFDCEGFWIHTLQGLQYVDRNPKEYPAAADLIPLQNETRQRTEAYLSTLTEQQLNTDTQLHFPEGDSAIRTPALILHHVLTHAFHHKGQIVGACRELGHPAPDTHLIQFE